jgi:hypothetical protein
MAMKLGERYNRLSIGHDEAGTGFVLFAALVAIVLVFCA